MFFLRNGNNNYYKLNVPATSPYRWMEIIFDPSNELRLYVKWNARPTQNDYDWMWRGNETFSDERWETFYIPSTDPNFNAGYFYFWFHLASGGIFHAHDSFVVNLSTWYPLIL